MKTRAVAPLFLTLLAFACSSAARPATSTTGATAATPTTPTTPTTLVASPGPCGRTATPPTAWRHVVWIWMENHNRASVIGTPQAPYVSSLVSQCGTATKYATVGSPSLPNYIGATAGSTFGISDDAGPNSHRLTGDNLFRQVRAGGGTARSYAEAMPSNCDLGSSGRYAVKHNPAAYYIGAGDRAACLTDDIPLPASLGPLPTFTFVIPDLCDDTHDCSVATGDKWLAGWLPAVLDGPDYRAGTTAVFLVWDEYTPTPNVFIAPSVRAGSVLAAPVDHYSLLRTTEEMLGLPLLGRAAQATSLRPSMNL